MGPQSGHAVNVSMQTRVMTVNVDAFKAKAEALSAVTQQAVQSRGASIMRFLAEQPPGQMALNEAQVSRGGLVDMSV